MLKLSQIVANIIIRPWLDFAQHTVTILLCCGHPFFMLAICRTLEYCMYITANTFYICLVGVGIERLFEGLVFLTY